MQGLAAANSQGIIQLRSLETFLDTSFRKDNRLAIEKHQQNPVIDGSPLFPMAIVDTTTLHAVHAAAKINGLAKTAPAGLQSLKTLGRQPIDNFFSIAQTAELDTVLRFENYTSGASNDVPFKIVSDYINYLQGLQREYDSLQVVDSLISRARDSIYTHTDRKDTAKWKRAMPKADSLYNLRNMNIAISSSILDRIQLQSQRLFLNPACYVLFSI